MSSERGSVTVWMLALVLIVVAVGGLALDLWRILDHKQRMESLADSAAVAGAALLDEGLYRSSGQLALDPTAAESRARAVLSASRMPARSVQVVADAGSITVTLQDPVELSLLALLLPSEEAVVVSGSAVAGPSLRP